MRYKPYRSYKPSGVEWLGKVPGHWDVKRGRCCLRVNPRSDRLRELDPDDEVSFVPMEAVGEFGGLNLDQSCQIGDIAGGYTEFQDGDIVVAKITPCFENGKGALATGLLNGAAFGTTELHVLRPLSTLDRRFLFYLTISSVYREAGEAEMYGAGGQKRVPPEFNKDFRTPLPSLAEQHAIADFLDAQTAKLDTLVAKKRALIEKLKEKRAALISHTVTRGLPPDAARTVGLDPHPKLKPSGIDWLGNVPEHWGAKRLKTSATYWVSNVDKVPADDEVPIRLCNYTDVYYHDHIRSDMGLMETTATPEEIRRFVLKVGDVAITKDSEEWSDIAIPALVVESAADLVCGYHLAIVRPNGRVLLGPFLLRVFQACAINQQFQVAATGVTRYGLPKSAIGEAWLPLPPVEEQHAIADFLDARTAKFDQMVAKVETAIERLQEYRAALITAAVTGKIDVRGHGVGSGVTATATSKVRMRT